MLLRIARSVAAFKRGTHYLGRSAQCEPALGSAADGYRTEMGDHSVKRAGSHRADQSRLILQATRRCEVLRAVSGQQQQAPTAACQPVVNIQ
jgi:hypothetical protein